MKKRWMMLMIVATATLAATAERASAQDRPIQQFTDAATGAVVRLYATATGPRLEVESRAVTVRKQAVNGAIITSLSAGRESLVIENDGSTLSVSGSKGRVVAAPGHGEDMRRARQLVAQSTLSRRAAALMGSLSRTVAPTLQPLLLTTRAFLLEAANDEAGTIELKEWIRGLRMRSQVVKIGVAQRTPTECYDAYGAELVAAYDQYVDCIKHLRWWELDTGPSRCLFVFEFRILGASTWYAGCVSFGWLVGK